MNGSFGRRILVVTVMVAIGTITGPFGTFETMTPLTRFIYWGLSVQTIAVFMIFFVSLAMQWRALKGLHPILRIALGAIAAGPFGATITLWLDTLFRGYEWSFYEIEYRWGFVSLIGFCVGVLEQYVRPLVVARETERRLQKVREEAELAALSKRAAQASEPPLFLRNLPKDLGQEIMSISTQDHYLDVVTAKGSERILKRMSDAIAELNGFAGFQIHRSHWVALNAIDRVEKDGRKFRVVLKNGQELPVSRPNVPELTAALNKTE